MKIIISFDLDGTLVKPGFGDSVWLDGLPKIFAKEKHVSFDKAKLFFKEAYDNIGRDRREWYDLTFWIQKYNLSITPNVILDQYEKYIELYEDTITIIKQLSKNFQLIISSGAMKEFINKELEYTGLLQYFTELFSSTTDTKTVKKDPAFYKMVAKSLGRSPSSIIHIGDNINNDYYVQIIMIS